MKRHCAWVLWCGVALLAACGPASTDAGALNREAQEELVRARDGGDLRDLAKAEACVAASLRAKEAAANPGGVAMRGRVCFAEHRFAQARDCAEALIQRSPDNAYGHGALGDALFGLGDYDAAVKAWARMESLEPHTAGGEARTAQWFLLHGQVDEAKEHFAESLRLAQTEGASAGAVAGCAVMLGEAEFRSGDWAGAEREYTLALSVRPGHYAATEHLAELRGAQKRTEEALTLYRQLLEKTQRPELMQAMGDLLAFVGRTTEAKPWHERARDAYLASVGRGEIFYLHHLSGLLADSLNQPEEAVTWARRDLEHRHTIQAYDSLAWALAKAGQAAEAKSVDEKALATGTHDPHILYHAAMIRMGAGDIAAGRDLLRRAAEANPRFNAFHVHR